MSRGDWLWKIARNRLLLEGARFPTARQVGQRARQIYTDNRNVIGPNPRRLRVGMVLAVGSMPTDPAPVVTCRNSSDPRCGPFRWDPDRGPNEPLSIELTATPDPAGVDQEVVFGLVAIDPDGAIGACSTYMDFGDGSRSGPICVPTMLPAYGPWTPPFRLRGVLETQYRHRYNAPGTHVATIYVNAGPFGLRPYDSTGTKPITVTIRQP